MSKIARKFCKNIFKLLRCTVPFFLIFFTLLTFSCSSSNQLEKQVPFENPSWYIKPKQNDFENLFGVAEGYTLEEATKYALADSASRLMTTISSESNLLREENQNSTNEEIRQKVRQSVDKISFSNFKVSKSEKLGQKFFVEVQIERRQFINEQKDRITFIEKKISDLEKNLSQNNPIQKRNNLIKILDLSKELELKSRILSGSGEEINLAEKLARIANFQNQLEKSSDKIEFFFEPNSPKDITQILRTALNKEKIKIATILNSSNSNQILVKIKLSKRSSNIYESFITKFEVDFENLIEGKVVASNTIEVSGSSSISEKESYSSALKSLAEKIEQEGSLRTIGIIN